VLAASVIRVMHLFFTLMMEATGTGCSGEYLYLRGMKKEEAEKNCMMRISINFTVHQPIKKTKL
jgi:hypothetical protein